MRFAASIFALGALAVATHSLQAGAPQSADRQGGSVMRHIDYHARVYYGAYYRWPYDYRNRFDFPWHAGPSREHWPIPAPQPNYCHPGPTIIATPYQ
jgi:hypothetical protein